MSLTTADAWAPDTTFVHQDRAVALAEYAKLYDGAVPANNFELHYFAKHGKRVGGGPPAPRRPLVAPPPVPAGTRDPSEARGGEEDEVPIPWDDEPASDPAAAADAQADRFGQRATMIAGRAIARALDEHRMNLTLADIATMSARAAKVPPSFPVAGGTGHVIEWNGIRLRVAVDPETCTVARIFGASEPVQTDLTAPVRGHDNRITGEAPLPQGGEAGTTEEDTMTTTPPPGGAAAAPAPVTGELITTPPAPAAPAPGAPGSAMTIHGGAVPVTALATPESFVGTLAEVGAHVKLVGDLMREHLRPDVHYGVIPGTDKKTLLKAGAEKLCLLFKLVPKYQVTQTDLGGGHREISVVCELYHRSTGQLIGTGVGSCSTMETKYRYRNDAAYTDTGESIPRDAKERKAEYRKQGFGMRKIDGVWCWVKYGEDKRVENPDIADTYNTVLKIGKKRSLVDAAIQATSTSDLLTQDVGDPEREDADAPAAAAHDRAGDGGAGAAARQPAQDREQPRQPAAGNGGGHQPKPMSEAQANYLGRLERQHNTQVKSVCAYLANNPPDDPKVAGVIWTRPDGSPAPLTSPMASFLIDGYMKGQWDQL